MSLILVCRKKNIRFPYLRKENPYPFLDRNLSDQQSLEWLCTHLEDVYFNHWEKMKETLEKDLAQDLNADPGERFNELSKDYLRMPVPAYSSMILLQLKAMFLLASKSQIDLAEQLRSSTAEIIKNLKCYDYKKKTHLLAKVFEWESIVRSYNTGKESILSKVPYAVPDINMSPAT